MRPVLENAGVGEEPAKLPSRNTLYSVTPMLSVEGVQERTISEALRDLAVTLVGIVGGVVSGGGGRGTAPGEWTGHCGLWTRLPADLRE